MKHDRILAEVWKAKDSLAKRFGYDVHRLAEHFRRPETDLAEGVKHPKKPSRKTTVQRRKASLNRTIKR
jgi:hypothetical protein